MQDALSRAIAIVGVSAILPDAPDASTFWGNISNGRYSISDVPEGRWNPHQYYDPDPKAPDKTYSRIGGWVREWAWEPYQWHLPIPPKIADAMDDTQKWALACAHAALLDYGDEERPLDRERTAVILGNAMGGELHYQTTLRVMYPEVADALGRVPAFNELPAELQKQLMSEFHGQLNEALPAITEDTMPGELSNCMAGRVANLFDFHGPNYVCDAACASALAAMDAAVEGLVTEEFDAALVGGVDRNMGASTYVKFCKIGALSATGTRPYADGADGFVMGEGAAFFLLKRLADAERNGDRIYAVLRGIGGSSDGKGKGITAPNPKGQQYAIRRAWQSAGLAPETATLVEGHGTSTKVGDVVEVESLNAIFGTNGAAPGSIALGSVKSNIGHLKSGAGAAGLLKTALALHHKQLPPSLNFERPNPNIDFASSPFAVNTELRPWDKPDGEGIRRAGVSAFGFGGTNFHAVLEEYIPGRLEARRTTVAVTSKLTADGPAEPVVESRKAPLEGILVVGAADVGALRQKLEAALADAASVAAQAKRAPDAADLQAPERLAIAFTDAEELTSRGRRALQAFEADQASIWKALQTQGVFRGSGAAAKVAFLYTGQGSQYPNMLADLRRTEPLIAQAFAEADEVMTPLLGRPLTDYIFVDGDDPAAVENAEAELRRTEITQPAVLTTDTALTRLYSTYGIVPDMVMGHSLGEYGALVASGAMAFGEALEAVSARGREMTRFSIDDNGAMAAVFAPLEQIEAVVESTEGNVVIANINSGSQAVIGGATAAVQAAVSRLEQDEVNVVMLPVSHAFHTSIVAPASEPLREVLQRMSLSVPRIPLVANVTGEFYPRDPARSAEVVDMLARQVASPVQFVKGLETLYQAGARVFVEVGPKKALQGFADDVLGGHEDVLTLSSNHPKLGDSRAFNQALAGLYAAGLGAPAERASATAARVTPEPAPRDPVPRTTGASLSGGEEDYRQLGHMVADMVSSRLRLSGGGGASTAPVVSGAALGLPGTPRVFDEGNVGRILSGEQEIDVIPTRFRQAIAEKHITRLVKEGSGEPHFETIDSTADVIKLAGREGEFDLVAEYGVPKERVEAFDITTSLAIAAGIDALRDAGIPLVMQYRKTTKGTLIPTRYMLPEALRDDTGIIFASCFPGLDAFADELTRYQQEHDRELELKALLRLRERFSGSAEAGPTVQQEINRQLHELQKLLEDEPYDFDRRFLFRILAMGHSQMAEYVGARGPNTQINSACASTTQAFSLAQDWIRAGRCRRVLVIAADDVTSDHLLEWVGAGFLASGAAATDEDVTQAALPFDRRRHGMIMGMGACGVVLESPDCLAERGMRPICEVLSTTTANSAFHGTRLDIDHICKIMESVVSEAEQRFGIDRRQIAGELMFMSHETYTPARGGSASAEIHALRHTFGDAADQIVIANTKGFTGHAMGVGIEDTVAIKALETGIVPPVANFREQDPELGSLNLSRGGVYPVRYALRLGAGFGSQISMSLMRWVDSPDGTRPTPDQLGYTSRLADPQGYSRWLQDMSEEPQPELEVVQRTLRVKTSGQLMQAAAASSSVKASADVVEPAPVAAVEPAAEAEIAAADTPVEDEVTAKVLAIVADKTGYPPEMLDLDLDLEADLGIDTVKQAETFAAIREEWDIPRDENLKLREYPTIAHAIAFVRERAGIPEPAAAPAPEVPAPAVAAPEPAAAPAEDEVTEKVLAIVADKTGYPPEMLDLDLDLEADLGIDTVKQAETFAAIREQWGIPRDENLNLRDYPTIAHAIAFVRERAPAAASGSAAAEPDEDSEPVAVGAILGDIELTAALPRRAPRAVLRPSIEACKETGLALSEGSRVVVMPDAGGIAAALVQRLEKRGVEVLQLEADASREGVASQLHQWLEAGPVHGVYWLPALDIEEPATELSTWRRQLEYRVKLLYIAARELYGQLDQAGSFLITGSRLGGLHGYDDAGATAPMGGAVTGFAKALAREREAALVKVVDFGPSRKKAGLADILINETLRDPGAVEVGYSGDRRWAISVVEEPLADSEPGMRLDGDSVFVVTGAAGSIVSAITADLAAGSGGSFYLLDLAPEPDPEDPDIRRVSDDRDDLKRDIFQRLQKSERRVTPVMVEKEIAQLERANAALTAIEAVRAAGGTAVYCQVDLTDTDAVAAAIGRVRREQGRIDVLLHAAGMEISHPLPDKPEQEFDLVFDVKCDGWFNLITAIGDMPLGAAVAFSSIAGRFGNMGQTDYSAANDLLCKSISAMRTTHPQTRALAIDWTAWAEIGMASRGSIPQIMAAAGIDMLSPAAGIPLIRRELTAGCGVGELVVAERLGILCEERDEQGGLNVALFAGEDRGPMLGSVTGMSLYGGLEVETELDPTQQPFLDDHRIDDTAVLPGVMAIEAFGEMSLRLFPDRFLTSAEEVQFLAPLKFYRDEPQTLLLNAWFEQQAEDVLAHCRCRSSRQLHGRDEPQLTTHFLATLRLSPEPATGTVEPAPEAGSGASLSGEDLYRIYFHGPAYRVVNTVWQSPDGVVGALAEGLPADVEPPDAALVARPRLIELCFQTAGALEIGATGEMGLPERIDCVSFFSIDGDPVGGVRARIRTAQSEGGFDAEVVDGSGRLQLRLQGYRTARLPGGIADDLLEPLKKLVQ